MASPVFVLWARDVEVQKAQGVSFRDRLLRPQKRLSEYSQLLRDMLQVTDHKDADFERLSRVVLKLGSLAEELGKLASQTTVQPKPAQQQKKK